MSRARLVSRIALVALLAASPAAAQFTGPSRGGQEATVAGAQDARIGSYVTVTGNIVEHMRSDYFLFRDATGEMMVEIPSHAFGGRSVAPDTTVRLVGEVDRRIGGQRYLWVKSLEVAG